MDKILKNTFIGAAIGFGISLIACWIVGCEEIASCFMSCLCGALCGGSSESCSDVLAEPKIMNCLIYITLIGAVIGCIYGIYQWKTADNLMKRKKLEESSEQARQQRVKWAGEVKQKALNIANTCEKNAKGYKALISPNYKSDSQMDAIIKELANAAELKGKVDAMANDTKTKGGASK